MVLLLASKGIKMLKPLDKHYQNVNFKQRREKERDKVSKRKFNPVNLEVSPKNKGLEKEVCGVVPRAHQWGEPCSRFLYSCWYEGGLPVFVFKAV